MTRATDARMTEAEVKARAIAEKQKEAEGKKLQKAFCECFATESGKVVLKWLCDQCSYQRPLIVANPATGESLNTTLYAEGRRTLYLRMRKMLHRDILAQVEVDSEGGLVGSADELLT